MVKTVGAVYDGATLRPDAPLGLEPNTRVRVTIETIEQEKGEGGSFFDVAQSLNLEGPADWARNLEGYLYGDEAKDAG